MNLPQHRIKHKSFPRWERIIIMQSRKARGGSVKGEQTENWLAEIEIGELEQVHLYQILRWSCKADYNHYPAHAHRGEEILGHASCESPLTQRRRVGDTMPPQTRRRPVPKPKRIKVLETKQVKVCFAVLKTSGVFRLSVCLEVRFIETKSKILSKQGFVFSTTSAILFRICVANPLSHMCC